MKDNLCKIENIDIISVDSKELVDIKDIEIDYSLPISERILNYINKVKNPYCIKVNGAIVKLEFSENNSTLEDIIIAYLKNKMI